MSRQAESGNLLSEVELDPLPSYGPMSARPPAARQSTVPRKPVPSNVSVSAVSSQEEASKHAFPGQGDASGYGGKTESGFVGGSGDPPYGRYQGGSPWLPGVWRQFPYRGAIAIIVCICFIIACIVVLVVSDGEPTEDWKLSPTVYLALFMTGTNMMARFAFHDGVKISWWYKAFRGGTLRDLHIHWSHADGFWTALLSGRDANLMTLASIAVTIMVIDQPLIQRASMVVSVPRTYPVPVIAPIAPELPWGFTGFQAGRGDFQQVMTAPMIAAFNDFQTNAPMVSLFTGCTDSCTGWVEAGGLAAICNSTTGPIIYESLEGQVDLSTFSVDFELAEQSGPPQNLSTRIIMYVAYTNQSDDSCGGLRTEKTCYLAPATIKYPIKLTGNTLTIDGDVLSAGQVQAFSPPPPTGQIDGGGDYDYWTLGGLYVAATSLFNSNATYHINDAVQYITLPDTLSTQFLQFPAQNLSNITAGNFLNMPAVCNSSWADPSSYIISTLNEIAFRISLQAASYPYRNMTEPPAQNIEMLQTSIITIYKSEYRFLIASTVLTTAFILFIIPTFNGWWELGRPVTLNPLETGKAFDAPLLRGPGSNVPLLYLVDIVGARNARYGEVESYTDEHGLRRQMKLADPVETTKPRDGMLYE